MVSEHFYGQPQHPVVAQKQLKDQLKHLHETGLLPFLKHWLGTHHQKLHNNNCWTTDRRKTKERYRFCFNFVLCVLHSHGF